MTINGFLVAADSDECDACLQGAWDAACGLTVDESALFAHLMEHSK